MTGESPLDADVLISGMGPSGVVLAGLLGKRGVRVTVFDKLRGLYELPRAAGMDHEVMRVAQELGVAPSMDEFVVPYRPSVYLGAAGQVIKRLDSPPPPFRLGWEPMFAFDQPAFETALRKRVGEMPSVTVVLEAEVGSVGQDEAGAWVDVVRAGADAPQRHRGKYVVACDGGSSRIRTDLGITMQDLGFHENWLVVDAIIEDDVALARLPQTQVQYCEPGRPATFINLVGRHRRWEISLRPDELPVGPVDGDLVWQWLDRWIRPGEARIWRAAAYMFHGLVADEWRRGRIFLAGDAAHMTPPFMAQGMAQGIRDVQNLAWKLDAVLRGKAADGLLDSYQGERRPHVVTTTTHTIELGRVISERDAAAARARDEELLAPHDADVPVTLRSDFLPPLHGGLLVPDSPGSGQILPQPFVLTPGGARRLDDVTGAVFRVISVTNLSVADRRLLSAAIEPLDGQVVELTRADDIAETDGAARAFAEQDSVMSDWLAGLGRPIVVARPDHRVYATAATVTEVVERIEDLRRKLSVTQITKKRA